MAEQQRAEGAADWRAESSAPGYAEVRQRLLEAGRSCVGETGPGALRMQHVAREAGCCRATLYRYFASKDELLAALAVERSREVFDAAMRETQRFKDPRERLPRALLSALEIVSELPDLLHARTASEERDVDALMAGAPAIREAIADFLEPILEDARRMGVLRDGVAAADAAEWLIVLCVGLVNSAWLSANAVKRRRVDQVRFLRRFVSPSLFVEDA